MIIIIDPIAFEVGNISVYWYGIIIAMAILIGMYLVIKESRRQKIDPEFFLDFFIWGIPAAIIGARLYYVIFRWQLYQHNPMRIFAIREGGLAIHGAVIAGLLVLIYLTRKRNVSFKIAVDILAPALAMGQAIGRWGNFINQEAHGSIVSEEFMNIFPEFIKKQMYIKGNYYHPAFLYESIWDLSVFIFLLWFRRKDIIKPGDIFLGYIVFYSIGRFFIEGMRTDSLMLGSIKVAQLVSIILIAAGIIIFYWRHRSNNFKKIK